jgi:hypothetical protein
VRALNIFPLPAPSPAPFFYIEIFLLSIYIFNSIAGAVNYAVSLPVKMRAELRYPRGSEGSEGNGDFDGATVI